ncbi:MAG: hypothetical protein QMD10_09735, partial [Desulfitobacteriaceae bacterium]|nr:hypothetical protein [Desulfitobacteriaceae bacterium]
MNRLLRMSLLLAIVVVGLESIACAQSGGGGKQTVKEVYPDLASSPLASAKVVALPKGIILQSGELQFTQKDLDAEIRNFPKDLWPQLKKNLIFVLENVFTRSVITWEAKNWSKN